MNEPTRTSLVYLSSIISIILLVIGCVSPLTPSEGLPRPIDVIIFYAAPLMISGALLTVPKKLFDNIFVGSVFVFILTFGAWVLSISYRAVPI